MNEQTDLSLGDSQFKRPPETARTLYHVGISGGKDSSAALLWMLHESGVDRKRIVATFCDTGNEHAWTYGHVEWLSKNVHPIETIRPKRGFFDLADSKRRFPSTKARFCTEFLKIIPSQEHITRLKFYGLEVIAVSGVRADESADRAKLAEWDFSSVLNCPQWRPLIRWTLDDVKAIHARHGVPLNPLYAIGAQRVGCWPCIMSRKSEIRTIAQQFPERIAEIRTAEEAFEKKYGRYSSFFPAKTVPARFRSKPYQLATGETVMVATIDDVVRWSLTGDRARGAWDDSPQAEQIACTSGHCE